MLRLAKVENGRIVVPGGATYAMLVIPPVHVLQPDKGYMSVAVAKKILQLLNNGATILMDKGYSNVYSLKDQPTELRKLMQEIHKPGKKGRLISLPYDKPDFKSIGIEPDVIIDGALKNIAWTHRRTAEEEIYFISNQVSVPGLAKLSLRTARKSIYQWDPVTGSMEKLSVDSKNGRQAISLFLHASGSAILVCKDDNAMLTVSESATKRTFIPLIDNDSWTVAFDTSYGGPSLKQSMRSFRSWTESANDSIKYYSGPVRYLKEFTVSSSGFSNAIVEFDSIYNVATVLVNGMNCGTVWTPPYRLDMTKALKVGKNRIEVIVSNTWANRLNYDQSLPVEQRVTNTNAGIRLKGKPLLLAGLVGKATIILE
ncbi:MAG: hypothetical protein EOO88_54265 [Pedobacter sp.]|nr:MAG: hypothetical protein EOO88_54265 [Pedobacter sp.]